MNYKKFAISLSTAFLSTLAWGSTANPGQVTISIGGTNYVVNAVQGTYSSLLPRLQQTPWYDSTIIPDEVVYAYRDLGLNFFPNVFAMDPTTTYNLTPLAVGHYDLLVASGAFVDGSNTGALGWMVENFLNPELYGNNTYYWLVVPGNTISSADTRLSMLPNALALRNAFNLQSAKIAQGLGYDCTVYDQKNICVSFVGSKSEGSQFDATVGALILAHKPASNLRIGAYLDQSMGTSSAGGLTLNKGNPGYGFFGVWSQNADGSGVQIRAAANFGKVGMESTRTAIDTAEAGTGKSDIQSNGFELQVSRSYALNPAWSARPFVGYRKITHTRAAYTELASDDVTAPLTYSRLQQSTESLTAGATFKHTLSAQTSLFLTAAAEQDLKNRIDSYRAVNADIGDIDPITMGAGKKTRPMVSIAVNHDIDKTQRLGASVTQRKELIGSGSSTTASVQYSVGF